MTLRLLLASVLVAFSFSACETPYKKKEQEDKKPSHDQAFQAFHGRLSTAVAKRDRVMIASLMAPDFGYRWDPAPAGENVFDYWDQRNLWPQLELILREQFVPNDTYMVAPPAVVTDPNYAGYRAGMRLIQGSWKFAYFVPGEEAVAQ
jgi:hypothetical protein